MISAFATSPIYMISAPPKLFIWCQCHLKRHLNSYMPLESPQLYILSLRNINFLYDFRTTLTVFMISAQPQLFCDFRTISTVFMISAQPQLFMWLKNHLNCFYFLSAAPTFYVTLEPPQLFLWSQRNLNFFYVTLEPPQLFLWSQRNLNFLCDFKTSSTVFMISA